MTTLAYAASDSAAMIGRSVKHTVRNLESLLMSVILPVVLMLMFVYVFGGAIDPSGDYANYVVPGIILLCTGYGAASTAVDVARDMTEGVVDRFRSMPILSSAVLTGHVVASLARNTLATLLVIGVAFLTGFRPDAGVLEWLAVAGMLVLWVLALSWVAVCFGLIARTVEGVNGFTFLVLFLPYLSSAFVPVETMRAGLRAVWRTSRSRRSPRRCAGCCSARPSARTAGRRWPGAPACWWLPSPPPRSCSAAARPAEPAPERGGTRTWVPPLSVALTPPPRRRRCRRPAGCPAPEPASAHRGR